MNILYLSQEYPPETGNGGIGTYTYNIARAMSRAGHSVHVLSSGLPGQPTSHQVVEGVNVHRVHRFKFELPILRRLWFNYFPWNKHQWEYIYSINREIGVVVRANDIQLIEAPEIWAEGLLYALRRRVPIVIKLHTPLFLTRKLDNIRDTLDWRTVDIIDQFWTKRADQIISASISLCKIVAQRYHLDPSQIRIVPETVDAELFRPHNITPPPAPIVLYVGRLEPRKGIFTIAEAMPKVLAEFPRTRFVFLGGDMPIDGNSSQGLLTERLRKHSVEQNAEFRSRVPPGTIADLHNQSAVSIFPSTWENCAVACLEAMACGTAVIATDVGGFPEMIEQGISGLLVPPGDPEALANGIVQVLRHPEEARRWGINARTRIEEHFASEVVAGETLAVYEQTIQEWNKTQKRR